MPSSGTISQIQLPNGNIYDLDSEVSWEDVENKPSTFPPSSHTHDDRYYTESEVNDALSEKASTSHTHTKSQITDFPSLLALGETSTTAYRGDRGKIAYDHSQTSHAPANAEANQNAFSNITVGSTTIAADSKTGTFTLTAGSNVTLTPDATNDKITIAATDTTYSSKSAASGGTDVSLVTTGEKYTWNNKGTYSKPSGGIPKTDLASAVQTSLGKADTALQSHQDISGKENTSNKVTSWSTTTTDTHYPSEKLVKAGLDGKADTSHNHTKSEITDFPALATVATSGSYSDLSNKPTIPTVNNATLTIQKNGTTVKTFTANASSNVTANITVPTKTSDITNDSGFIDSSYHDSSKLNSANITHETWTFTLDDNSTVTKEVALWISQP